ncbi:MAG TPA: radical SAM protein [candidate division Zixibacteria bacterium]|nr:radical SAM protein [candidate division Zixibacteria bacterium]
MSHRLTSTAEARIEIDPRIRRLRVVLIKPSKYDDDGYVIRFWKGVLPSNTLNVLHGLTEDIKQRRVFGDLPIEVVTYDETAEKVPLKKIIRWSRRPGTKLLVCLVGVQTNQFPRAVDIARPLRAAGITVVIGGFHTSGTINMLGEQEPEIQELVRESICVVSGEVEGRWETILSDFLGGRLKPIYSFAQDLQNLVDIGSAPLPKASPKTMRHFAYPSFGTADTSRGCPFSCSFCTIINVQGRKMRERSPQSIAEMLRKNYLEHGVSFYFFTDDNFARKKLWRETFEEIIKLREEGIKITFMIQVDLAKKPKDFVQLAAKAGCTQVFIGMESVNPENLKAEGKKQNNVEEYRDIIKEWHDAGVVVHTGYIIGLPWDSKEQVRRDIRFLMEEIGPDQASFFMLTPLPGSHDHREMKRRGEWMDPDFNKRDSFHATIRHPRMTTEEWTEAYEDAWKMFYSKENMIRILSRWTHHPRAYWNLMSIFFWYKNAALIERQHPMIAGFFRLKDRKARRPGYAIDSLPVHAWKRTKEIVRLFLSWAKFLKEMEEVWLQTRKKTETEERLLEQVQKLQTEVWQALRIGELQATYASARDTLSERARAILDPLDELASRILKSRHDLNRVLRQWEQLRDRIHELRAIEGEAARRWLDEMCNMLAGVRFRNRIPEWQAAYARMRGLLPAISRFQFVKFDALNNRVIYSRQELQRIWSQTIANIKQMRWWEIRPLRLTSAMIKDFCLTTFFAFNFRDFSQR